MTETFAAGAFYGLLGGMLLQTIAIYILVKRISKGIAESEVADP